MKPILKKAKNIFLFLQGAIRHSEWTALPNENRLAEQNSSWQSESILKQQEKKWFHLKKALSKPGAELGINHEADIDRWGSDLAMHNQIYCFAYAFGLASKNLKSISWLDFGGGLGQYSLFANTLFPDIEHHYYCFDFTAFCQVGKKLNPAGVYGDNKKKALARKYDFIFAGSSLWYDNNWAQTLIELRNCTRGYLLVSRQLMTKIVPNFIVEQDPTRHGYRTRYRCWVINKNYFLKKAAEAGLSLVREIYLGDGPYIYGAPEQPNLWGFLFTVSKKA